MATPVRPQVLAWGHASPFVGHPGAMRILEFLRHRFWWPSMDRDVRAFVAACQTCTQNKEPQKHPQGLLRPLPIPSCPWSHLSLGFITSLPHFQGKAVILVVVDRFSKAGKFVPLPKLPSTKETAELVLQHIDQTHDFRSDLVSDMGPNLLAGQ